MKNKEITIYELMGLIKDGKAPKKVFYNGSEYKFCNDIGDYRRLGWEHCLIIKDIFEYDDKFHNSLYNMLNDTVEILPEENNEQYIKMQFPDTFEEFVKSYSFIDDKEIYTNGSELIPTFRLKQWIEHKKEENDEWEDIEEIETLEENIKYTKNSTTYIIGIDDKEKDVYIPILNQLIKNQRKIIEKLESKDE